MRNVIIMMITTVVIIFSFITYYFNFRIKLLEQKISRQNEVLTTFITNVKDDLHTNALPVPTPEAIKTVDLIEVSDDSCSSDEESDHESDNEDDKSDNEDDKIKSIQLNIGSPLNISRGGSSEEVLSDNASTDSGITIAPVDTEPTDAEPTDAEQMDAEQMDAEQMAAEPTDAEPTDAEPTDAEPTDAEPTDAEPTDAEPTDAEPVQTNISYKKMKVDELRQYIIANNLGTDAEVVKMKKTDLIELIEK